jgi:hypothetical protein
MKQIMNNDFQIILYEYTQNSFFLIKNKSWIISYNHMNYQDHFQIILKAGDIMSKFYW